MSRLLALATNTFREAVRDKVLYRILFFAVVGKGSRYLDQPQELMK